jgi:hypothetical protein
VKIGLYDVDSTIPNLALMKLSAYHKERGDRVVPYLPIMNPSEFDRVYASTVFKDKPDDDLSDHSYLKPEQMEVGGSGWDLQKNLPSEVERCAPDYSHYGYRHNIGFLMRGCRFRCAFCDVPQKEGRPKASNTVDEIWTQRTSNFLVLLDNDFFGNPEWRERIAEIRDLNLKICFSQGLNIRIITEEQCAALASVRFWNLHMNRRQVYFAWDRFRDEQLIDDGILRVRAAGIKAWQMAFFILIGYDTTPEQDYYRVMKIRNLGCDPYAMPYRKNDPHQKAFARWVNHRAIFKTVAWEDYRTGVKKSAA